MKLVVSHDEAISGASVYHFRGVRNDGGMEISKWCFETLADTHWVIMSPVRFFGGRSDNLLLILYDNQDSALVDIKYNDVERAPFT